ncbi:Asp-tRNA(Asn)/Glu-tRNA(Gln) amidotransferase subunit GatC [bacterium]|jgi:aspartyl/glutamyl-tRNA(Asn/Gln) amidotransferase C subunit|nr:Asp-tRNA(Asn)/Glu-tRNA(Gln) amidotransferase subunit GatC [bacterium]MBT3850597.1 Asp-tRNA(Asn)/Glu-tRNA(Gln) amidotransferase subunit GatC [bacterium]MBT4435338.1 Asp-tRNA(Asn)/Glu-tRNA(Gln) amidotransferase subunit GatC [bacterium]MDG2445513.1 Asp-tRNA(Asn)/Glu-tRNA(Gln) amidotransferase subunit GatC [Thermodesulfobacteriota bacterium]|tara:strand:+ start:804 stop:1091 length:288 start_codon:yes stop_codon:yes gene_type:complete
MAINKKEVLKISELSRLSIPDNKIDNFIENFSDIIEYIDLLSSAGVTDLVPEDSIEDYAIRDDSKIEKLQVEDVVKNSSKVENNFFAVTKVIDEE